MSYRPFSPSIFGPYRKFYEDKLRQLNGSERASLSQVKEEGTNISEANLEKEVGAKPKKVDFATFHKKQNIKFFKDSSSRRTDRMLLFQEGIKQKRSQILMDKRKCEPVAATPVCSNSNGNNIIEPSGNNRQIVKESRKDQLLRWKKEKEAAVALASKKSTKPPFKGGPVQTNKPTVVSNAKGPMLDSNSNKTRLGNSTSRPVPAHKDGFTITPQVANTNNAGSMRVTRAMSKAQSGATPNIRPPAVPVNKMQSLTINNKNKGPLSNNVKKDQKGSDLTPLNVEKNEGESKPQNQVVAPLNAPKPLKPKIDDVYIDFNSTFSEACKELRRHSDEWKNVVEWPDIPEDIREDIICSIGQANLILYSKLPQFGQLLCSYLCHEMNPGPILPCDLQGWWDVAAIQVDAVKSQFANLKKLQLNGWIKVPAVAKTIKPVLAQKSENKLSVEVKRKPVQASKGIRDFLAKKRQLNGNGEPPSEIEKIGKTKTPEKKFEGGFFAVNSPMKLASAPRTSTRISILKDTPNTPSRRSSSTNVSLRMLSVRKSMGSICKIGVTRNGEPVEDIDMNANL